MLIVHRVVNNMLLPRIINLMYLLSETIKNKINAEDNKSSAALFFCRCDMLMF